MNRRFALLGLTLLPVFVAQDLGAQRARGDQMAPASQRESFTSCRVGLGCTHFEGYVIVQRRSEATAQTAARPDATLSVNRLYLPMEDDKTP